MKHLTPFKAAICLSLMIHGGIVGGYYAFHNESGTAQIPLDPALEIVVVDEPIEVPGPITANVAEAPKPEPQSVSVQPSLPPTTVAPEAAAETLPTQAETTTNVAPVMLFNASDTQLAAASEKTVSTAMTASAPVDIDTPANYLFNPQPVYPEECRRRKQEGLVVLTVQVSREGLPRAVNIVQSSKFRLLDQAAANAIAHWRFSPAKMAGAFVASQIEAPIRFKLSNQK